MCLGSYQQIATGKVQVAYFENVFSDWSIFREMVLLSNQRFPSNSL
jgi:acyl-ACP thioesterase